VVIRWYETKPSSHRSNNTTAIATKSNRANLKSVEDNTKEKQSNEKLTDKWRAGKFSQASSFNGRSSMPFSELRLSEYQSTPGNNPGSNLLTKKQTQHLQQMSYSPKSKGTNSHCWKRKTKFSFI
jgi:hypothetical protein